MTIYSRPTNGVSYGIKYTVTSGIAGLKAVTFDFRKENADQYRYDLVANIQVLASGTKLLTNPADLGWTYPFKGVITVTGTLLAGSEIELIAQRASDVSGSYIV